MLKKTITYKNPFTDESVTEDFYFNISKAEATKLAMVEGEGMDDRLRAMIATENAKSVLDVFERIIGLAYGRRDGSNFLKTPEISAEFLSSEAYSELFLELIQDGEKMAEFVTGMLPKDMDEFLEKIKDSNKTESAQAADPDDKRPAWIRENREPTDKELQSMTKAQIVEAMKRKTKSS